MSRKYEGLIVLNTLGQEDSLESLVSTVGKEIEANGAKMDEIKQLGRKKFAYNARQIEGGHYVNYIFEAEPAAITKIQSVLALNTSIYLQQYQRIS